MATKYMWARVGMTIEVTEEQAERLQSDKGEECFVELLKMGKCSIDGETYFPDTDDGYDEFDIDLGQHGELPITLKGDSL